MGLALVLACDLVGDGNELGPKTIRRLLQGVEHHRATGDTLVVAASYSPDFPEQRKSMAVMMAEWLNAVGCTNVVVLNAKTFDSRGELRAFYEYAELNHEPELTIISAGYHLRRVKLIIREMYGPIVGPGLVYNTRFVRATADKLSGKEFILEPLKLVHVYLPPGWRDRAVRAVRAVRALGINPSW